MTISFGLCSEPWGAQGAQPGPLVFNTAFDPVHVSCTYLSLAARDWKEIMGTLSLELLIILEGHYAISRHGFASSTSLFQESQILGGGES